MKKYYEGMIVRAPQGFDEFMVVANGAEWESEPELFRAMRDGADKQGEELVELRDGCDLPEGVEDIRGRVHLEPQKIYAVMSFGCVQHYVTIVEVDR